MRAPFFFELFVVVSVLLVAVFARGEDGTDVISGELRRFTRDELPTGPLWHPGWERHRIRWFGSLIPEALRRAESRLGRSIEHRFTTVLVDGLPELRRVVLAFGGREVSTATLGVALPGRRVIVVRGDMNAYDTAADETPVTLVHEIAHLVIHREADVPVPRWFDEGLASWVATGPVTYRDESELSFLARFGGLYRLKSLRDEFPEAHGPSSFAYRQSHLMVQFLADARGASAPGRILDGLESGLDFEEALRRSVGWSQDEFEAEFVDWAADLHPLWLLVLTRFDVWILVGPLALWGALRHWRRRRRQWRRLLAEEAESGGSSSVEPASLSLDGGSPGPDGVPCSRSAPRPGGNVGESENGGS